MFLVNKKDILTDNFDLSINKYKKMEEQNIEYENPLDIYNRVLETENIITRKIKELGELL